MAGARVRELEDLYRTHYSRFVAVTSALAGDPEAGHDAVQEGFASALHHRRSFRGEGPLEAWVWRTVVNAARKARVGRLDRAVQVEQPAPNGIPDEAAQVRTWVAALPARQRLVVFLRYYADLDYRSIAEVLEIEVGTVSATLSSAHAALRKQLEVRR